jgi:hypothetical protein
VEWDPQAPVTPLGQLVFFAQFLQTSGRFERWVADCPWHYTSPNAPAVRDLCGTALLSVLAGHHRYAHVSALRGDRVNAPLLGLGQVAGADSLRRALAKGHGDPAAEAALAHWQQQHLRESYAPLLSVPWILDIDATVKTLLWGGSSTGMFSVWFVFLFSEITSGVAIWIASSGGAPVG